MTTRSAFTRNRLSTNGAVSAREFAFFFGAALAEFEGVCYAFVAEEVA